MIRVDSHQHFWRLARGEHSWLESARYARISCDFTPEDLGSLLKRNRIDTTVLVQAAESVAETQYLLRIAEQTAFVAGVVGWVDLEAADAVTKITELVASSPRLVGLRPMLQDLPDERWLLRPSLAPGIRAMQSAGLRFDALIRPRHLRWMIPFVETYSDLPLVIDHAAKPAILRGELTQWEAGMRQLARYPHVHCKLSGLVTEAGESWSATTLAPYVDILLDAFGPSRLMWGSDWPVLLMAGDYSGWLQAAETLTAGITSEERAQIFGGTAAAFYGIGRA